MMQKLFHISEEENIKIFKPRRSKAIWNYKRYVWAISEAYVHNYYLPRDCPRVCLRADHLHFAADFAEISTDNQATSYIFTSQAWEKKINSTLLYQYEFDPTSFELKDGIAGYYVSEQEQVPIRTTCVENIPEVLHSKSVHLAFFDPLTLQEIRKDLLQTTDQFSIIRWSNLASQ